MILDDTSFLEEAGRSTQAHPPSRRPRPSPGASMSEAQAQGLERHLQRWFSWDPLGDPQHLSERLDQTRVFDRKGSTCSACWGEVYHSDQTPQDLQYRGLWRPNGQKAWKEEVATLSPASAQGGA